MKPRHWHSVQLAKTTLKLGDNTAFRLSGASKEATTRGWTERAANDHPAWGVSGALEAPFLATVIQVLGEKWIKEHSGFKQDLEEIFPV